MRGGVVLISRGCPILLGCNEKLLSHMRPPFMITHPALPLQPIYNALHVHQHVHVVSYDDAALWP